jgi:hypothetical protein
MTMGEEEENSNSVLSRTQSSLELLCNTAAWKNAVEKTWTASSPTTTTTTAVVQHHPTEVHIQKQHNNNGAFARSASPTLSLVGGGGDASSVNHVTTASSVSSFDDSSAYNSYSTSPLSTSSVVQHVTSTTNTDSSANAAAAAYRSAMMGGLPLRLLGMPNMMNIGGNHNNAPATAAVAALAAASTPRLQPMMMSAAASGAPFSSTTTTATMPALSLPTLSSKKNKGVCATASAGVPPLFHLEKVPQGSTSNAAASTLLSEANLIHLSANNGNGSNMSLQDTVMTEVHPPAPIPVAAAAFVGTKNKKKLVAIMAQENKALKQQVASKDKEIWKLRKEMTELKNQIQELRQLPTGKISQIPVEYVIYFILVVFILDYRFFSHTSCFLFCFFFVFLNNNRDMIEMMQVYGSEVSDSVMPIRKNQNIQKASIVRQFRRWNPNFLEHFHHVHGKWTPKLGHDGELHRRQEARRFEARRKTTISGEASCGGASSVSGSVGSASMASSTTKNNKFNINTMGSTANTKKVSCKKMKKSTP